MSSPSSLPTSAKANPALRSNRSLIDHWRKERVASRQANRAMQWLEIRSESTYVGAGDSTNAELLGIRLMIYLVECLAMYAPSNAEAVIMSLVRAV